MVSVWKTTKRGGAILISAALVLAIAPSAFAQEEEPIVVGHLNYYTGDFADVGPWFQGLVDFTVDVINEDPPLKRPFVVLDEDIGTVGEGAVARRLIDSDGVDILLNPAHNYLSYRDYVRDLENPPLMPSVHGGSIIPSVGGTAEEPIFRGAPQDTGQATAAVLYAKELGAESIAIVATELEGSQLQKQGAIVAAEELGLAVPIILDLATDQPSYRAEI
ncbi:MAG: ABC transporter substrate-binding protein, partial [Chloroflexota bacterium]